MKRNLLGLIIMGILILGIGAMIIMAVYKNKQDYTLPELFTEAKDTVGYWQAKGFKFDAIFAFNIDGTGRLLDHNTKATLSKFQYVMMIPNCVAIRDSKYNYFFKKFKGNILKCPDYFGDGGAVTLRRIK
jgi:hypothetical protein